MIKTNLRRHEIIGLIMIFFAGTLFGIGLYFTFVGAVRPLFYGGDPAYLIRGKEYLLFPLFYGLAFLLYSLGKIEIKEAMPGKNR